MGYRFIVGAGGTGKTTEAIGFLLDSLKNNPQRTHILMVPEQATLQAQRDLVDAVPGGSVMDIDVQSFERLGFRVFSELGVDTKQVLEDTGKNLILRKIAGEHKDELLVLSPHVSNMGYIDEIKSLITEMQQYRVSPEALLDFCGKTELSALLRGKVSDMAKLYSEFCHYISGDYNTKEMLSDLLAETIIDSQNLSGAVIVFDGFTGFTPTQEVIVEKLLSMGCELVFTVNLPGEFFNNISYPNPEDLYRMSKLYILSVRKLGETAGAKEETALVLKEKYRSLDSKNVRVLRLESPTEELSFVASTIRELARKGVHYREIGIVTGDVESYAPYIEDIFSKYQIPVFYDGTDNIRNHPLSVYLQNITDIIKYNAKGNNIISLIKSPYFDVDFMEGCLFENYILATGIRGFASYGKDFEYRPIGTSEDELLIVNKIREKIYGVLSPVFDALSGEEERPAIEYNAVIKNILMGIRQDDPAEGEDSGEPAGIADNKDDEGDALEDLPVEPRESGIPEEEEVLQIINEHLLKIENLLGTVAMSFSDYCDMLMFGLSSYKLKRLPVSTDCVVFGDTIRTRLSCCHSLFIMGAIEGALPQAQGGGGLFNSRDREIIERNGISLAPGEEIRRFDGNFYLRMCIEKPRVNLFVTYPGVDLSGEDKTPSYVVDNIKAMFLVESEEGRASYNTYETAKEEFLRLLSEYRKYGETDSAKELSGLYKYIGEKEPTFLDVLIKESLKEDSAVSIPVLQKLFETENTLSVSRLEQYASCTYAYYLNYILALQERKVHGMNALDRGNIYHESLYNYSMLLKEKGLSFFEKGDSLLSESRKDLAKEAVDLAYGKITGRGVYDSAYDLFVKDRIKSTLFRTAWALGEQLKKGSFSPEYFETELLEISKKEDLKLSVNGRDFELRGKIDRIDLCKDGDALYVKVIDYKSSDTDISFEKLHAGLQLQLLFYLNAETKSLMRDNPKKAVYPAAVFYYHIDDPMVEYKKEGFPDMEEAREMIIKELMPQGLVLEDDRLYGLLDGEIADSKETGTKYSSNVVKININKGGALAKTSKTISFEDMSALLDFTENKTRELAEGIGSGEYHKNPYRSDNKSACDYCGFHSICNFTPGKDTYRDIKKIKNIEEFKDLNGN